MAKKLTVRMTFKVHSRLQHVQLIKTHLDLQNISALWKTYNLNIFTLVLFNFCALNHRGKPFKHILFCKFHILNVSLRYMQFFLFLNFRFLLKSDFYTSYHASMFTLVSCENDLAFISSPNFTEKYWNYC